MKPITRRVEAAAGVPGLAGILAERLAPTDLQSLLLDVFRRRSAGRAAAAILREFGSDRFVRPSEVSPRLFAEWDLAAFAALDPAILPVELSPVAPLASCAAVAGVSQDWSVATVRNSEVVSDTTNVLALEAARRRRDGGPHPVIHLAANQRVVRPQAYRDPSLLAHFRLFAMASAGRDRGSFAFEADALARQLGSHLGAITRFGGAAIRFRISYTADPRPRPDDRRVEALAALAARHGAELAEDAGCAAVRSYYDGFCFHVHGGPTDGDMVQLVDGGSVAWGARFLSDRKERMLVSGAGVERVLAVAGRA